MAWQPATDTKTVFDQEDHLWHLGSPLLTHSLGHCKELSHWVDLPTPQLSTLDSLYPPIVAASSAYWNITGKRRKAFLRLQLNIAASTCLNTWVPVFIQYNIMWIGQSTFRLWFQVLLPYTAVLKHLLITAFHAPGFSRNMFAFKPFHLLTAACLNYFLLAMQYGDKF